MATYAIGDVQGCYSELQALLNKLQFDPTQDTLWFVGDLVNRGPESLAVLRFVKELPNKIAVLGNHDFHLLAIYNGVNSFAIEPSLEQVLNAPDAEELLDWLRAQPLIYYDKRLDFVLTHAGIYPGWDLSQALKLAHEVEQILRCDGYVELLTHMYGNEPAKWDDNLTGFERLRFIINAFVRMRLCNLNLELDFINTGHPEEAPKGFTPWFDIPTRRTVQNRIIFGHWAALGGGVSRPNLFALDTGCVWGNHLTALCLDDCRVFSVPCGA